MEKLEFELLVEKRALNIWQSSDKKLTRLYLNTANLFKSFDLSQVGEIKEELKREILDKNNTFFFDLDLKFTHKKDNEIVKNDELEEYLRLIYLNGVTTEFLKSFIKTGGKK
ncbi:hypothetical protein [Hydrogenophaga sp.]|uniref:hypothetical protein n=1 Tax=Hydrogenophaga sp. TaxID=1904254 RepID=UPI0035B034DF